MSRDRRERTPELAELAESIKKDNPRALDQAWEIIRREYGFNLKRDLGLKVEQFVIEALQVAHGAGVLRAFARRLRQADLVEEEFGDRLLRLVGPSAYELQSTQNGENRTRNAYESSVLMGRACEHVCKIDVDGVHKGTGVLVQPTLVATAAHVLWNLIMCQTDGTLRAHTDSLRRLTVTFRHFEDNLPLEEHGIEREPHRASLDADWLAWGSRPTDNELSESDYDPVCVEDITHLDGPWDVVLIRLARPMLHSANLIRRTLPPRRPFPVELLHHPKRANGKGEVLQVTSGSIVEQLGDPPVRCLHSVNTLGGSSGAPMFDSDWKIVALHQAGGKPVRPGAPGKTRSRDSHNRAVPVLHWLPKLDGLDRVPYLGLPVIGRRTTQERIWKARHPEAGPGQRLLVVRGGPRTGLRYTKHLVDEMIAGADCGVVGAIDATNSLQDSPAEFAQKVAGILRFTLKLPDDLGVSTRHSEIRRKLVPALLSQTVKAVPGTQVWLLVEGLERANGTEQSGINNLLLALISALQDHTFLRLVLVGWPQTLPVGFQHSVEDLRPPKAEDVVRAFLGAGDEPTTDLVDRARRLMESQERAGYGGYEAAIKVVADLKRRDRRNGS